MKLNQFFCISAAQSAIICPEMSFRPEPLRRHFQWWVFSGVNVHSLRFAAGFRGAVCMYDSFGTFYFHSTMTHLWGISEGTWSALHSFCQCSVDVPDSTDVCKSCNRTITWCVYCPKLLAGSPSLVFKNKIVPLFFPLQFSSGHICRALMRAQFLRRLGEKSTFDKPLFHFFLFLWSRFKTS